MCSPRSGGGRSCSIGVPENRIGLRTSETLPAAGCASSSRSPRAIACGSANTCSIVLIGPFGTPAASSASTQSRVVRRAKISSRIRVSSTRFSTRLPLVA